jgi:hypothetical protein
VKPPRIRPSIPATPSIVGAETTPIVEDDGQPAADVAGGLPREGLGPLRLEREADVGLTELAAPRVSALQVAPGHDRPATQEIEAVLPGRIASTLQHHERGRHSVRNLGEQPIAGRRHAVDEVLRELGYADDQPLGLLHVRNARELNQDSIAAAPVLRDHGLGDAELVHAPLQGPDHLLQGLRGNPPRATGGGALRQDLQHEVRPATQVQAELEPARVSVSSEGRPDRHPAGDQERTVEDGAPVPVRHLLSPGRATPAIAIDA